jgi:AcrR family transcriptional regulator
LERQRARIMDSARAVFADRGYTRTSFVEVVETAGLSEAQLHRYFPGGRADLVTAVARQQLDELVTELRRAARVPFPPRVRLTRLLTAMFRCIIAEPGIYPLLFIDAALAVDPALGPPVAAARAEIASEVAGLFADAASPSEAAAASAGVIGFTLSNIGLCLAGGLDPGQACRVTCGICTSQIPSTPRSAPSGGPQAPRRRHLTVVNTEGERTT